MSVRKGTNIAELTIITTALIVVSQLQLANTAHADSMTATQQTMSSGATTGQCSASAISNAPSCTQINNSSTSSGAVPTTTTSVASAVSLSSATADNAVVSTKANSLVASQTGTNASAEPAVRVSQAATSASVAGSQMSSVATSSSVAGSNSQAQSNPAVSALPQTLVNDLKLLVNSKGGINSAALADYSQKVPLYYKNAANQWEAQGYVATGMNDYVAPGFNYGITTADKQNIINWSHLTTAEQTELSEYAIAFINSIRAQLGLPNLVYTQGAQNVANEVVQKYYAATTDKMSDFAQIAKNQYLQDTYETTIAGKLISGHDMTALKQAQVDQSGDESENLACWWAIGTKTMADLKQEVADSIFEMMFNDAKAGWGHTMNFTGAYHPGAEGMGVAIDRFGNLHFDFTNRDQKAGVPVDKTAVIGTGAKQQTVATAQAFSLPVVVNKSSAKVTGWQKINGQNYYYAPSTGVPVKGWQKIGSAMYYFGSNGAAYTGQQNISGYWYYFIPGSNIMRTGFQWLDKSQGNKEVYYNSQGWMVYGQQNISGHWYYFMPGTGKMATG